MVAVAETDFESLFREMDITELEEVNELLLNVLNEKKVANSKLFLESPESSIAIGKSIFLKISCEGREITPKTVLSYQSSDESVAVVNKGKVTAKSTGSVTITATAVFEDGGILENSVMLDVIIPVSSIKINGKPAVFVNQNIDVNSFVSIAPENATEKRLVFSVDDETIATIDTDGRLTGKKAGLVNVKVTSAENTSNPKSTIIPVNVNEPVRSIQLNVSEFEIPKGNKYQLEAIVLDETATDKDVIWESENSKVATVSKTGQVTGTGTGSTIIKCIASDGSDVYTTAAVTVIQGVTSLKVDKSSNTIKVGTSWRPTTTILPKDATQKKLIWTSSKPEIAEVNDNGNITAKQAGECIITATTTDGSNKSISIKLKVENLLKADEAYTLAKKLDADYINKNKRLVKCSSSYKPNDWFSISYELVLSKGYKKKQYSTTISMSFNDAKTKDDIKPGFSIKVYVLGGAEPNTVVMTIAGESYTLPSSMWNWHYGDVVIDFSSHLDWLESLVKKGGAFAWSNSNPASVCALDFSRNTAEHKALSEVWNIWKKAGLSDLFN